MGSGLFEKMLISEIQERNAQTMSLAVKTQVLSCLMSMFDSMDLSNPAHLQCYSALIECILQITVSNIKDLKTNANEDKQEFEEDKYQGDSVQTELKSCKITDSFVVSTSYASIIDTKSRFITKIVHCKNTPLHQAWENYTANNEKIKKK